MTDIIETGDPLATQSAGDQTGTLAETRTLAAMHQFALYPATASQITAGQNDYELQDTAFLRISSDAAYTITGLAGGTLGRLITVVNAGSFTITFADQDTSSAASNRIITPTGSDLAVAADQAVTFLYDTVTQRWRVAWTSSPSTVVQPTNMVLMNRSHDDIKGLVMDSANSAVYFVFSSEVGGYNEIDRYDKFGSALMSHGLGNNPYFYYNTAYATTFGDLCDDDTYLYGYLHRKAPDGWLPVRLAKSNAGLEEITFSGTAAASALSNVATDGTFFYIHQFGSATVYKYSASGTTFTYVSTITLADSANVIATDGTNIWYVSTPNGGASTVDNALYKADMTGATVSYRQIYEGLCGGAIGLDIDNGYLWGHFRARVQYETSADLSTWIIPIEKL